MLESCDNSLGGSVQGEDSGGLGWVGVQGRRLGGGGWELDGRKLGGGRKRRKRQVFE